MSLTPLVSGPHSQAAGRCSLAPMESTGLFWVWSPDPQAGPGSLDGALPLWLPGRGPVGTSVLLAEAEA